MRAPVWVILVLDVALVVSWTDRTCPFLYWNWIPYWASASYTYRMRVSAAVEFSLHMPYFARRVPSRLMLTSFPLLYPRVYVRPAASFTLVRKWSEL